MLVVDDHALYRRGLVMELDETDGLEVVAEAADGEEAVELAIATAPDVILMDVHMPGIGGIEATRRILEAVPGIRVLMLAVTDDPDDLLDAVKAGAAGYLLKEASIDEIGACAHDVARGHSFVTPVLAGRLLDEFAAMARREAQTPVVHHGGSMLTDREIDVLRHMAQGADNASIAHALGMTQHSVRNHVRNMLDKLHLASRTEAVLFAVRTRIVDP